MRRLTLEIVPGSTAFQPTHFIRQFEKTVYTTNVVGMLMNDRMSDFADNLQSYDKIARFFGIFELLSKVDKFQVPLFHHQTAI